VIILDTNVISEVMRGPRADERVLSWVRSLGTLPVTTVITVLRSSPALPSSRRVSGATIWKPLHATPLTVWACACR